MMSTGRTFRTGGGEVAQPRKTFPDWVLAQATASPAVMLSVSDIERMAKAGVVIAYKDIAGHVVPDQQPERPRTLEDAFWERWRRANIPTAHIYGMWPPYRISTHPHGDKVTVFVQPHDKAPFTLEDESCLYPSDALMAKLALWEKTGGKE